MKEVNKVTPALLVRMAKHVFDTGKFLFITGQGGIGKTSIAYNEIAAATGRRAYPVVNLCGYSGTEVVGYGNPQPDGGMTFFAPSIWPTYDRVGDEPILLILDELPDYNPEVRALLRGLYPATGSRYVGTHKLGSNVAIVVTGNSRHHGTRSAVEDAPFTERCVKVSIQADLGDWITWYDSHLDLVRTGSYVPAFLSFGTTTGDGRDLFAPPIVMPYDGAPHPTPRTWETVARAESTRLTDPAVYQAILRGSVGDVAATAYMGFLQHVDQIPDIKRIKANGAEGVKKLSPQKQYALVTACLATALTGVRDPKAAVHAGTYDWLVDLLLNVRGDIREFGARSAERRGIPLDEHPQSNQLRGV
jgi:hypothetical protein